MTVVVNAERLARFLSPDVHLTRGTGKGANGEIDVCVMQAVDWLAGGNGQSDGPDCASRSIRRFCIRLNDSPLFEEHRDLLKPYAERIVGTYTSSADIERKLAFICADYAVRIFAPIWMRGLGHEEWAKELEAVPSVTDKASSIVARDVARKVRADAYDAAYAAAAASAAYDAYDAAAAYAAASAAYDAAYDARKRVFASHGDELRTRALECLDKLIEAGQVPA